MLCGSQTNPALPDKPSLELKEDHLTVFSLSVSLIPWGTIMLL